MKIIFYICFAISLYTIASFLFDNGNEILKQTVLTGNMLSNDFPVIFPIIALILLINGVGLAMKIINNGGFDR